MSDDPKVRAAFQALLELTDEQRGLVLCWFCDACHVHVGPGDAHKCEHGSNVWPPANEEPAEVAKPTAPATVHMLAKTLRSLRDVAPEGKAFVVVTMKLEDARRVPLYAETTITLRAEPEGGKSSEP